jgi:hypothetical protein
LKSSPKYSREVSKKVSLKVFEREGYRMNCVCESSPKYSREVSMKVFDGRDIE